MKKPIAFCFDLDGTVTQEELLPLIAKKLGLFEEINILTRITLDGLIPFENSFKLRVKLLSTIPINEVQEVVRSVRLDPQVTDFIRARAEDCYIVTGNLDVWVGEMVKERLQCGLFSSQAEYDGNVLRGLKHILNKREAVDTLREKYDRIVAIGDSMNDCPMFEAADVKIAYGGVHQPTDTLLKLSDYLTYDAGSLVRLLAQNH